MLGATLHSGNRRRLEDAGGHFPGDQHSRRERRVDLQRHECKRHPEPYFDPSMNGKWHRWWTIYRASRRTATTA